MDISASTKQQKSLPPAVFHAMIRNRFTPTDKALGRLAGVSFFFGMQACEFFTVKVTQQTKWLKIRNIQFFRNNIESTDIIHTGR